MKTTNQIKRMQYTENDRLWYSKSEIDKCMIMTIEHFHFKGYNDNLLNEIFNYFNEYLKGGK